jgi:hypothetical protein
MATIVITFDVADVDPTLVDPLDIADEIMDAHEKERRAGNTRFALAQDFLSAEWEA